MDATREYYALLSDGDPEVIASTEQWPGQEVVLQQTENLPSAAKAGRRHDVVGTCPTSRLHELAERFPKLIDEIIAKRGWELTQL